MHWLRAPVPNVMYRPQPLGLRGQETRVTDVKATVWGVRSPPTDGGAAGWGPGSPGSRARAPDPGVPHPGRWLPVRPFLCGAFGEGLPRARPALGAGLVVSPTETPPACSGVALSDWGPARLGPRVGERGCLAPSDDPSAMAYGKWESRPFMQFLNQNSKAPH